VACVQAGRRRVPAGRAQCVARQGLRRDGGCHPSDLVQPLHSLEGGTVHFACTVMHTACPAMHACCACALPPHLCDHEAALGGALGVVQSHLGHGHSVDGAAPGGSGGTAGRQQWQGGEWMWRGEGRVPGKQRRCDRQGTGPGAAFCTPKAAGPTPRRRLLLSSSAPAALPALVPPPTASAARTPRGASAPRPPASGAQTAGRRSWRAPSRREAGSGVRWRGARVSCKRWEAGRPLCARRPRWT
jgi:hypothetical protein